VGVLIGGRAGYLARMRRLELSSYCPLFYFANYIQRATGHVWQFGFRPISSLTYLPPCLPARLPACSAGPLCTRSARLISNSPCQEPNGNTTQWRSGGSAARVLQYTPQGATGSIPAKQNLEVFVAGYPAPKRGVGWSVSLCVFTSS
jgi:hypothetical protein